MSFLRHRKSSTVAWRGPLALLCIFLGIVFAIAAGDHPVSEHGLTSMVKRTDDVPPYLPVYRIPLRVHLGKSGRSSQEWKPILAEINFIWRSQAGICFEIQTVNHNVTLNKGLDIWFFDKEKGGLNGYFESNHKIWVRDTPRLRPAPHPARYPAARTAAHEIGHALHLLHRQDSDDNLMRSQTFGWQLNEREVGVARTHAALIGIVDTAARRCGPPQISP
jgi:hypothetical protein